ncbi:inositol monophosphatase 2 isoform X2 [Hyalella azteca]|uniref:Inositol-1-monophosphatase n=1 Tax=Hyalella azteca TaxID=294128 RepID=A0A8B7PIT6_HYAAZ|nr:inositol monophosphatase 2 isoform X2 [Hyalella azteca]
MNSLDLDDCFQTALDLAKEAGLIISEAFKKAKKVEEKTSPRDLVTETDKLIEDQVISKLQELYPNHKFIGEESTAAGIKCELTNDPTWIIDPVDGTLNFVHSFPYTCISIALWVDKKPCLGVVYNPVLQQLYTARKNAGAFLNGERIRVSGKEDLSRSLVVMEMGYRPDEKKMEVVHRNAKKLIERCHGVRSLGSAALHMCMVAEGAAEGSVSLGLFAWDKAAAVLIVQEAGGVVLDNAGGPHDLMNRRVLCAASPQLAQQMVQLLEVYDEDRD